MHRALDGLGILVTRPAAQAEPLCAALAEAGARVYRLPALLIEPVGAASSHRAAAGPIDRYQIIVFVSTNAVLHGACLLDGGPPEGTLLLAVGPATAQALADRGHALAQPPEGPYDSESLLASPLLREVAGKRILIVRGEGGREHLATSLLSRGASVQYSDVYRRVLPPTTPLLIEQIAQAEQALAQGQLHMATATSGELLDNTLRLFPNPACLGAVAWLAGSRRIGQRVRELGFTGDVVVAERPDDTGLLEALRFWWRHHP
jgi:uroporphyrinogen-III synthase